MSRLNTVRAAARTARNLSSEGEEIESLLEGKDE
jgi:hypothetical protein